MMKGLDYLHIRKVDLWEPDKTPRSWLYDIIHISQRVGVSEVIIVVWTAVYLISLRR